MTSSFERVALLTACVALAGCEVAPVESQPPLRPLMYTELPEMTPQAAQVRERRLMRELLEGAEQERSWGHLAQPKLAPRAEDAPQLGALVFEAMTSRDESLWEHAFVKPLEWTSMVKVDRERARGFVDQLLADSRPLWEMFDIEHASEAPEGGMASIFEFDSLELGYGRTMKGRKARSKDIVAQFWNNTLRFRLKGTNVTLEVRAPKILRLVDRATGAQKLALAAPLVASAQLETFIEAGLHLKPELLRNQEYPFPLAVGNFWRFRREERSEHGDPRPSSVDEVLLEVVAVERFGSVRMAKLRWSYNDPELSKRERWWLLTPRRVYPCSRQCRRKVERVDELMEVIEREAPLFEWPLRPGESWRRGEELKYEVQSSPEEITIPSGTFVRPSLLVARGMLGDEDPFMNPRRVSVWLSRGEGAIKIEKEGAAADLSEVVVVEEMIESRIMP